MSSFALSTGTPSGDLTVAVTKLVPSGTSSESSDCVPPPTLGAVQERMVAYTQAGPRQMLMD